MTAVLTARPDADPLVLVELGVRDGASMEMWAALLSGRNACIIGVDNSPHAVRTTPGTYFIDADVTDTRLPAMIQVVVTAHYGMFQPLDLVVDDASHDGNQTLASYNNLCEFVGRGGFYVIEDWYVGGPAWPDYDEGMLHVATELMKTQLEKNSPTGERSVSFEYGLIVVTRA